MLPFIPFLTLAAIAKASLIREKSSCPSFWADAAQDLKDTFTGSDGKCNNNARAAIRLSFHDCFPEACDGSIILSDECTTRQENKQLVPICDKLQNKAAQYNSSVADMIQLGAAIGLGTCPGSPLIQFLAGRSDSNDANPLNQIPSSNDNASVIIAAFAAKGFSTTDLVALVGAHSTAKRNDGVSLDSTVEDWDTTFYSETASGKNPSSLKSDLSMANSNGTKQVWSSFAKSQTAWNHDFVAAMKKLTVMGNDMESLVDCSSVVAAALNKS